MDCPVSFTQNSFRKQWDETASRAPFRPYPEVTDNGLIFGVDTVLAKAGEEPGRSLSNPTDQARIYALLAIAGGRSVPSRTWHFLRRALEQWNRGEKALAQFELAFANLPRLKTREEAWPLCSADTLLSAGMAPHEVLRHAGLSAAADDLAKYAVDEPRVPAGQGRESGEWTFGDTQGRSQPAGEEYAQNSRWPNRAMNYLPVGEGGGGRVGGGRVPAEEPGQTSKQPVQGYEVAPAKQLQTRSVLGDGFAVHHAIQAHPAEQIIPHYNRSNAPAITIPHSEHWSIPKMTGTYQGTARDLLANDIWNLRNNTEAPRSALQQLIELNKSIYPKSFSK